MRILSTYSDWATALEKFGNGDDTVLTEMNEGKFILDAGTVQRFYIRVEEVYKMRKQTWIDKLNRSFQFQTIRSESEFSMIIRNAKANLIPLVKFVAAKGLPEHLRNVLSKDLNEFVAEVNKSMKENILKGASSGDALRLLLNSLMLSEVQEEAPPTFKTESITHVGSPGRRIIF